MNCHSCRYQFFQILALLLLHTACGRIGYEMVEVENHGSAGDVDADSDVDTGPDGNFDTNTDGNTPSDVNMDTNEDSENDTCDPSNVCCDEDGTWNAGEVTQPRVGLVWRLCPIGQTWIPGEDCKCMNESTNVQWCDAVGIDAPGYCAAAKPGVDICQDTFPGTGFRLPTREEFVALLGNCPAEVVGGNSGVCDTCAASATCSGLFGLDEGWYWSSTPDSDSDAWLTFFDMGAVGAHRKDAWASIRCVRPES